MCQDLLYDFPFTITYCTPSLDKVHSIIRNGEGTNWKEVRMMHRRYF